MNRWILAGAALVAALVLWALLLPTRPRPGAEGSPDANAAVRGKAPAPAATPGTPATAPATGTAR
jgi:hypothetical protein